MEEVSPASSASQARGGMGMGGNNSGEAGLVLGLVLGFLCCWACRAEGAEGRGQQ